MGGAGGGGVKSILLTSIVSNSTLIFRAITKLVLILLFVKYLHCSSITTFNCENFYSNFYTNQIRSYLTKISKNSIKFQLEIEMDVTK